MRKSRNFKGCRKPPFVFSGFLILIVFIHSILLVTGCSKNQKVDTQNSSNKIYLEGVKESLFSDVIDTVLYTKLLLPENLFIGQVDKVILENQKIFVFDYSKSRKLFAFDNSGVLVFYIDKYGRGPSEYFAPLDFIVINNRIEVLDVGNKVIVYDMNGEFVEQFKLPFNTAGFSAIDNGKYVLYTKDIANLSDGSNANCQLVFYDRQRERTECLLEKKSESETIFFAERNLFSKNNGNTYFSKTFTDSVFSFNGKEIGVAYQLDFGKEAFPRELINTAKYSMRDIITFFNEKKDKSFHTPNLYMSENYLVTSFDKDGTDYVFFDRDKKILKVLPKGAENDKWISVPFYSLHQLWGQEAIFVMDPNLVLSTYYSLENDSLGVDSDGFKDFASELDINDPPILVKYVLK